MGILGNFFFWEFFMFGYFERSCGGCKLQVGILQVVGQKFAERFLYCHWGFCA